MIISYEMFRKHIDLINTVPYLEIIICDEGHRLKNVDSTKTSDAIKKCVATKRIVLTGTPIQNDLQELFAIVDFVAPSFLGTLNEFRQQFELPISKSREPTATAYHVGIGKSVSMKLQEMLSLIMIRRCQSDILVSQLPEKRECIMLCYLNKQQCHIYRENVTKLFDAINRVPPSRCFIEAERSIDASDVDEDDDCRENTRIMDTTTVLSSLLRLRQACDYVDLGEPLDSQDSIFACSAKIAILDSFLSILQSKFPGEKVVVVSNFTSTLDVVQKLLEFRALTYLRLDGSVPVAQRQHLVDRFNMPFQTNSNGETFGSFVFLLSALAGGVGINLIGASRLILMDPSWNPATDKQAMARIWREGQKRPVFIYRMISPGTIEGAMFRRQQRKLELENILAHNSDAVDREDLTADAPLDDLKAFTVRSLGELVYSEEFCNIEEERGSAGFDIVLDTVLSVLGSNCIRFSIAR
jgi:SNF2 family DNA or RNA helicase